MDEFALLRQTAANKRDVAVRAAHDDYNEAVRRINALKRQLGGKSRRASRVEFRPVRDVLLEVLPTDRTFSVEGAYRLCQGSDPKRYFHMPSVRATFADLRTEGIIQRVKRGAKGVVQWALVESQIAPVGMSLMQATDACEQILRSRGPQRPVDLVAQLQAMGYREDVSSRTLLATVASTLTNNPERFTKGPDKRWRLAE